MNAFFLMLLFTAKAIEADQEEAEMFLTKTLKEADRKILQDVQPSIHDIKTFSKNGIPDEIILKHIKETKAIFRLSSEEIIDLKKSGVSQKVINFMIHTGQ